jgi:hypothetical protein
MELRIAAFLSGDEKMIEIFRKGEDVHASVASFVFKVPQDRAYGFHQSKLAEYSYPLGSGPRYPRRFHF